MKEDDSEVRPEDVQSKGFRIAFPYGYDGNLAPLMVTVLLESLDFEPPRQSKNIFVPPDKDSPTCAFMLIPKRIGTLTVLVELRWEDATRGQRHLKTVCTAEAVSPVAPLVRNVAQLPILVGPTRRMSSGAIEPVRPPSQTKFPHEKSYEYAAYDPEDEGSEVSRQVELRPVPQSRPFVPKILVAALCVALVGGGLFYTVARKRAAPGLAEREPNAPARQAEREPGVPVLPAKPEPNPPATLAGPAPIISLRGQVVDSSTNVGISGVQIEILGMPEVFPTDKQGNFRIDISGNIKSVYLRFSKPGCTSQKLEVRWAAQGPFKFGPIRLKCDSTK